MSGELLAGGRENLFPANRNWDLDTLTMILHYICPFFDLYNLQLQKSKLYWFDQISRQEDWGGSERVALAFADCEQVVVTQAPELPSPHEQHRALCGRAS